MVLRVFLFVLVFNYDEITKKLSLRNICNTKDVNGFVRVSPELPAVTILLVGGYNKNTWEVI